jgi:hypothetical protein
MLSERRLIEIEGDIPEADADQAAAIAFAAICQVGHLGREAGEAFAKLAEGASDDADMGPDWDEGCAQIERHFTGL